MGSDHSRRAIARCSVALLAVLAAVCPAARGEPNVALRSSVTQYGITWNFSQAVPVGQFVNGDYYVVGAATVTSITPAPIYDPNGITRHGSVLNLTTNQGYTGFDNRLSSGRYRSSFDAHLPIAIKPGDALVSSVSVDTMGLLPNMFRPSDHAANPIRTAAVLTCLSAAAPADAFRPSYLDRKHLSFYREADLQWGLLPNLSLQGVRMQSENFTFTINSIADMFQRPWLDTITFGFAAPMENMPVYGREVARLAGVGTLLLESNYTQAQKRRLLINMVQVGVDYWGIATAGYYGWQAFGGHNSGREWLIIFGGMMLGDANMARINRTLPGLKLQEDMQTIYARGWTGTNVVYAGHYGTDGTGQYGPYEHLWPTAWASDLNENYRRCCTSLAWVGQALAARRLGAIDVWKHPAFFDYVDRWMAEANDATFRQILQETRGLNYASYAWENQTWDPFVTDMWSRYRGYIAPLPASNWYGAAGNWSDANNWPAGEPNASLSACVTNGGVVTLNQSGRRCWFLAVGGVPGEAGTLNLTGGSLAVGWKARIGSSGTLNLQGGALLPAAGDPNAGVPIDSDGLLRVLAGGFTVGAVTGIDANILRGTVTLDADTSLTLPRIRQQTLTVGAGARLAVQGPTKTTSVLSALNIAGSTNAWTGTVDVGNKSLVVACATGPEANAAYDRLVNQARFACNNLNWDRAGLTSTSAKSDAKRLTAVAVVLNRDDSTTGSPAFLTKFDTVPDPNWGVTVNKNTVLVKYTWYGDADLNGIVDQRDLDRFSTGYADQRAGASSKGLKGWAWGDFDNNGTIDERDLDLFSTAYSSRGAPLAPERAPGPGG